MARARCGSRLCAAWCSCLQPSQRSAAQTAGFPDRPLKMVAISAGGGTDVIARIVAQAMSIGLHQSVVVENRPGASGMLAAADVAPRGGRRLHADDGQPDHAGGGASALSQVHARRLARLHRRRAPAPAAGAGREPEISGPLRRDDCARQGKARTLNFALPRGGVGTTPHMAGELFAELAGIISCTSPTAVSGRPRSTTCSAGRSR